MRIARSCSSVWCSTGTRSTSLRRARSAVNSAQLKLQGLQPDNRYEMRNIDTGGSQVLTGRELMDKGMTVSLPETLGTAVVTYKRFSQ